VFATLVNPPPRAVDDLDGLSLDALADLLERRLSP
jgi:hypothetical protein